MLIFGPRKLPEIGRTIGKAVREFKKSTEDIKEKFEEQIRVEEFKSLQADLKRTCAKPISGRIFRGMGKTRKLLTR